jgi:quinol monooxygenase YgiN
MNKYGLHGHFKAKPGVGEDLAEILLKAAELMKSAEGCHLYVVSLDHSQSDTVWVTEIWDSKGDHDNSLALPGVKELITQAMPLLDGMPQAGQNLTILGGLGIN